MRLTNALMIVSRIPLAPISRHQRSGIFEKLLKLDQAIVSGNIILLLDELDKTNILVVLRRALHRFVGNAAGEFDERFVNVVKRSIVEVYSEVRSDLTRRTMP